MTGLLETVLVLLVFVNLRLLGASRLGASVRAAGAQGVLLGLMPVLAHRRALDVRLLALAAAGVALKGAVFPWLLFRALRRAKIRREVEPLVGYTPSMLFGVAAVGLGAWIAAHLPLPGPVPSRHLIPVALATMLTGLFLIVARRKAINQVIGYLVFENGIYAFGVGVAYEAPLVVEVGVLLDVLVGVFVMGIAIFHISREFDSIDTRRLQELRD